MNQLARLKNSFIDYLSPKRRRTIGPDIRTPGNTKENQRILFQPASDPQHSKSQIPFLGEGGKQPWSPTQKSPRKRPHDDDDELYGLDERATVGPEDSVSQVITSVEEETLIVDYEDDTEEEEEDIEDEYKAESGELEGGSEDEGEDESEGSGGVIIEEEDIDEDPEPEVSAETKVEEFLARQAELALRQEDIAKARAAGDWHPDELFVYERLLLRSFEELIPKEWKIDFPTLPELLFTDEFDKTFINYHCLSSYRGVRALKGLLSLGIRVKDKLDYGLPAERLIEKEILDYVKWSEQDGGYHRRRFIPVLSVVRARPRQDISSISKTITDQMNFLAQRHRESLGYFADEEGNIQIDANRRAPPLLYGIIVAQNRAIFMTLDSANPHAVIRHLRHFDFSEKPEGVWNGFAIAILVIAARNYLMSIINELEVDDTPLTDDDA